MSRAGTTTEASGLRSVTANSLSHGSWTLISRLTGLGRVAAIAAVLGPTFLGNTYQLAVLVPTLTYELTGALFPTLLVPQLVGAIDRGDRKRAAQIAGGFLTVAMLGLLAVTAVGMLASPYLLDALSFGIGSSEIAAEQQRVGVVLLALLMPLVLVYALVGTATAVMNAHGRFALPAGAPVFENLGVIATMGVYAVVFGTGTPLEAIGTAEIAVLGGGTLGAASIHAGIQWWGTRRTGIRLRPHAGWRTPEVRTIISQLRPTSGYAVLNVVRSFGALLIANRIAGGVVAFQFAQNFARLAMALAGRPVGVALLPRLARLHRDRSYRLFHSEFVSGLALTLFFATPLAVGYGLLAGPLAGAVSFGEMATVTGEALLAAALASLALGSIAEALFVPATSASYSLEDARTPYRAMISRTALSAVGMVITFAFLDGKALLIGLGLSISLGNVLGSWHLISSIRRRLPKSSTSLLEPALQTLLVSVVVGLGALLALDALDARFDGKAWDVASMALVTLGGATLFVAGQWVLRSTELKLLTGGLKDVAGAATRVVQGQPGRADHGGLELAYATAGPDAPVAEAPGRLSTAQVGGNGDVGVADSTRHAPLTNGADDPWFVQAPKMRPSEYQQLLAAAARRTPAPTPPRLALRYVLLAVVAAALGAGGGYGLAQQETELRAAQAKVFVPVNAVGATEQDRTERRLGTQVARIESRDLLLPIAEANAVELGTLEDRVDASIEGVTEVIRIEVRDESARRALRMTSQVVDTFLATNVETASAEFDALMAAEAERISARTATIQRALRRIGGGRNANQTQVTARARALVAERTTLIRRLNEIEEERIAARVQAASADRATLVVNPHIIEGRVQPEPIRTAVIGGAIGLGAAAVLIVALEYRRRYHHRMRVEDAVATA